MHGDYLSPVAAHTSEEFGHDDSEVYIIIEPGEDGWLVVTVPALPGCVTQGRTPEEAVQNAKEAIEAYLESLIKHHQPIPDPDTVRIEEVAVSV